MSEEPQQTGTGLIQNLGTEPLMMENGNIDDLKFSVLDEQDTLFVIAADLMGQRDQNVKRLLRTFLRTKISVNGRGRNDAIRGEAVMKGIPHGLESEVRKPDSWVERNITRRNWKQEEYERLGLEEDK